MGTIDLVARGSGMVLTSIHIKYKFIVNVNIRVRVFSISFTHSFAAGNLLHCRLWIPWISVKRYFASAFLYNDRLVVN